MNSVYKYEEREIIGEQALFSQLRPSRLNDFFWREGAGLLQLSKVSMIPIPTSRPNPWNAMDIIAPQQFLDVLERPACSMLD